MGCKHKANEAVVKTKKFRSGLKELPLQIAQFPEPQQPTERKKKIKETSPYMAKLRSSPGESPRFLGHSVSCQMTFIIKHLNVNFDRLVANCFPRRAAYKFPAADDVDDLWRGKCAAPSTNSNEPSNGQSSVFGLFIFLFCPAVFVSFHLAQQIAAWAGHDVISDRQRPDRLPSRFCPRLCPNGNVKRSS